MRHHSGVLIRSLRIGAFAWDIVNRLAVLPLVASHHVDRLLDQVEIEVLIAKRWRKVKIAVYERLRAGIKESVNVRLIPSRLFDWLEFRIEIVEPLPYIALVRFEGIVPRWIIKAQKNLLK